MPRAGAGARGISRAPRRARSAPPGAPTGWPARYTPGRAASPPLRPEANVVSLMSPEVAAAPARPSLLQQLAEAASVTALLPAHSRAEVAAATSRFAAEARRAAAAGEPMHARRCAPSELVAPQNG